MIQGPINTPGGVVSLADLKNSGPRDLPFKGLFIQLLEDEPVGLESYQAGINITELKDDDGNVIGLLSSIVVAHPLFGVDYTELHLRDVKTVDEVRDAIDRHLLSCRAAAIAAIQTANQRVADLNAERVRLKSRR
jgi:hypothetical protein